MPTDVHILNGGIMSNSFPSKLLICVNKDSTGKEKNWTNSEVSNIEVKKEKDWKIFINSHSEVIVDLRVQL